MSSQNNTSFVILGEYSPIRLVLDTNSDLPTGHPEALTLHIESQHDTGWTRKKPSKNEGDAVCLIQELRTDIVDALFDHDPILKNSVSAYLGQIDTDFVRLKPLEEHIKRAQHFSYYGCPKVGDLLVSKKPVRDGTGRITNLFQKITDGGRLMCLHFQDKRGHSHEGVTEDPLLLPHLHKLSSRSVHLLAGKGFSAHQMAGFVAFQTHIETMRAQLSGKNFHIRLDPNEPNALVPKNPFSS